ncbi:unnamed protein product [Heterobilharzia americana]|nr:unnamed protein product [Heterobilharzia americana]
MSSSLYNKIWRDTQEKLTDILAHEPDAETQKPEKDRAVAFQTLATFYIKYIQIFRNLERCYDQVVHPQKRRLLRILLDSKKHILMLGGLSPLEHLYVPYKSVLQVTTTALEVLV